MAATTGLKTHTIHDYPEHLNPFHEDDNHKNIRFWTIGRGLSRTNSITFSGIKDLRNSRFLRSFMRKDKKKKSSSQDSQLNQQVNGDTSPIVYRRALQYNSTSSGARSTVGSPERTDRYIYGGSVTPLPRSRFQERLRSPSQCEVNSLSTTPRLARSDVMGSRLSVESTNPFDECPVPPVRASRRKKKRAPMPPQGAADISITSADSTLNITEADDEAPQGVRKNKDNDLDIEELNCNIELKIVEDVEVKDKVENVSKSSEIVKDPEAETFVPVAEHEDSDDVVVKKADEIQDAKYINANSNADVDDELLNKVSFSKVDIFKYRRNSSVNEDDIRLRRGNLEDIHTLTNKRSKSCTNALDAGYVGYDIDLNENKPEKDANGNEEPQKVICKLYNEIPRKSIDNSISSTEKEFIEIDRATRELEREISKLNSALIEDEDILMGARLSVSDIKRRFDKNDASSPNPIPKPRRSHYGGNSPVNNNYVN